MKRKILVISAFMLIVPALLFTVSGEGSMIVRTDPIGDYLETGELGDVVDDIDITELSIDYGSFPALLTMKVVGDFPINDDMNYSYSFNVMIDSTGDGMEDIDLYYMSMLGLTVEYGDGDYEMLNSSSYTIEGAGTFVMDLPQVYFSSTTVHDISASASVTEMSSFDTAADSIEFQSTPSDDDDDDWPDDDDDDWPDDDDDDDWWDDDDDWWDDDDDFVDPATETPTDDSISVEIKDVDLKYDIDDEDMEIEIKISGTTSGDVDHCSNAMVTYDENGDMTDADASEWDEGPDSTDRITLFGYTMEMYFQGMGPEGEDDWSEWEFYVYMSGPYNDTMIEDMNPEDLDENEKMIFYVRAFSDEDETMWNQDSKDVTEKIMNAVDGGSDDDSPMGAGIIFTGALVAVFACFFILKRKK